MSDERYLDPLEAETTRIWKKIVELVRAERYLPPEEVPANRRRIRSLRARSQRYSEAIRDCANVRAFGVEIEDDTDRATPRLGLQAKAPSPLYRARSRRGYQTSSNSASTSASLKARS
jgi:hypothetical protein